MAETTFPVGPDARLHVSANWDGTGDGIASAAWKAVDGITEVAVSDNGTAEVPLLRYPVISVEGPVTTVITLSGWIGDDEGQTAIRDAREGRSALGFRWRPDGTAATGECWKVKVAPRDQRARAEGGLLPETFTLVAVDHVIPEMDYYEES